MKSAQQKPVKQKRVSKSEAANRDGRPLGIEQLREQITRKVLAGAEGMVDATMVKINSGQYLAMKYLFEMVGLYPAAASNESLQEDSLVRSLLRNFEMARHPGAEETVTKDSLPGECDPEHAVK